MNYDDDMSTPLNQLRPTIQYHDEYQYNPNPTFTEQPIVPQATMQRAPPMRFGMVENFPTHQTINTQPPKYPTIPNNYQNFNQMMFNPPDMYQEKQNTKPKQVGGFFENLFGGFYQRIKEPVIITILFIILAHRLTVRLINPFFPFVGENPSMDVISLAYRGFILSLVFMIIRHYL
jgi:hypothetical protein